ncbi:DUF1877 family protein [Lutibacter holmesii]|uniref:DUF1877 family protein n=1 Tax=Lutibacter holmesii TaxID=1137985 RepID=A0ABW3WQB6_9FLAO
MGQSSTLYEIDKLNFEKVKKDTSLFKSDLSKSYTIFEQNFFGLEFILKKTIDKKLTEKIDQIFNPKCYLGEPVDYENIDFSQIDFSEIEDNSIYYLNPELIKEINVILNAISNSEFIMNYNSVELNKNRIYPEVWHDDESDDQVFNKKHIAEGIEQLKSILDRAEKSENYIFVFSG